MCKVIINVIWSTLLVINFLGKNVRPQVNLPTACIEPRHDQANNCVNQPSFRYIKENKTCVSVIDKHCRGHNRFHMKSECLWRCSNSTDSSKNDAEKTENCSEEIVLPTKKPSKEKVTTSKKPRKPKQQDDDKNRNSKETKVPAGLDGSCKDRPTDCFQATAAYRFDEKTNECVKIVDNNCRGANRFTEIEECEFVCIQKKGVVDIST